MIIRLSTAWRKSMSNESSTFVSDFVYPSRSAFVESQNIARTPSLPSSAKRPRSIIPPSVGVQSILKSPVWTIVPAGECIASATASGTEWFTWINSTSMHPRCMWSPGRTITARTFPESPCSFSLLSTSAKVNCVP